MNKIIKSLITLSMFVSIVLAQADSTNTTINTNVLPLIDPPKFVAATNWFSKMATSMEISGVYTITMKNHKPQGGAVATMWSFFEEDWNDKLHFRAGPVALMTLQDQTAFGGIGTTINIVPNGSLEKKFNTAPILGMVSKLVKWSDLYMFLTVGSQVDKNNPFVGIGGGLRCW